MKSLTRGHLKAGIDSVRSTKLRSFSTMMGVIIGVASVISVVSIGQGIKEQVGGQLNKYGKDLISVRPAQLKTANDGSTAGDLISGLGVAAPLTSTDVKLTKRTPGIAASAPLAITPGKITGENGNYDKGFVIGTSADLPALINQSLAYGTFFESDDSGANVAVLGQQAVDDMFKTDVPLGRRFKFQGEEFIVRGIFNRFEGAIGQQADFNKAIFIPYDVAQRLTNNTAPTYTILARAGRPNDTRSAAAQLGRTLDKAHGGQSGFDIKTGNQNVASSNNILNLMTGMVAGIAAISLLVGGIGIMNVMLVSIAERMHEIGIRKAIGATNRQIMSQFMVEALTLSLTGGLIGVAIAYLVNLGLRLATSLKPVISWQIVAVAFAVSLLSGIIFGTVPALKAARKDPIEALRNGE